MHISPKDSVQVRDRPNGMARNLKEKIVNLGQLVRGDPRIRTPLDRRTSTNDIMSSRGGDSS